MRSQPIVSALVAVGLGFAVSAPARAQAVVTDLPTSMGTERAAFLAAPAALGVAVDFARSRSNVPVWLVGTSQGSTAAVNGAARLGGKVAGVVLTSSVTQQSRSGETVFSAGANAVAVPALVVANSRDSCNASPPSDAPTLLAAMAGSPRKEMMLFDSSAMQSDPCGALSPHGYLGIEASVIQRIAGWISAAPGR